MPLYKDDITKPFFDAIFIIKEDRDNPDNLWKAYTYFDAYLETGQPYRLPNQFELNCLLMINEFDYEGISIKMKRKLGISGEAYENYERDATKYLKEVFKDKYEPNLKRNKGDSKVFNSLSELLIEARVINDTVPEGIYDQIGGPLENRPYDRVIVDEAFSKQDDDTTDTNDDGGDTIDDDDNDDVDTIDDDGGDTIDDAPEDNNNEQEEERRRQEEERRRQEEERRRQEEERRQEEGKGIKF